jgi:hypothetical protein
MSSLSLPPISKGLSEFSLAKMATQATAAE